jgi:hypothetical protein
LLTSELVVALGGQQLNINLPSADPCSLLFLVGLLLVGESSIPGYGMAVRTMIIGTVRDTKVLSDTDVVVMGTLGVTTLHPRG